MLDFLWIDNMRCSIAGALCFHPKLLALVLGFFYILLLGEKPGRFEPTQGRIILRVLLEGVLMGFFSYGVLLLVSSPLEAYLYEY